MIYFRVCCACKLYESDEIIEFDQKEKSIEAMLMNECDGLLALAI